jgi:chemotaxis protein CheZ
MAVVDTDKQEIFEQIGQMTRTLNKTLQDLGQQSELERSVAAIPDARERLAYVLSMTEQAVSRVLNAVDAISPLQDKIQSRASTLLADWQRAADSPADASDYQDTVQRTQEFLLSLENSTSHTKERLLEIVMAQEFQDLTGQVVKKIVELASTMETQLLGLLDRASPAERKKSADKALLNGPAMPSDLSGKHALKSQAEVDKFLDDLGF